MNNTKRKKKIESMLSGFSEPDFEILKDRNHPQFESEHASAFNYANYEFDYKQLKGHMAKFIKNNKRTVSISRIADYEFHFLGILAWLSNNGYKLSDYQNDIITTSLKKLEDKYKEDEKIAAKPAKIRRTESLIAEYEGLIDDAINYTGGQLQKPSELLEIWAPVDADSVKKHFQDQLDELKDPEMEEFFDVIVKKRSIVIINLIMEALSNKKIVNKTRKPRKPRKRDPQKVVKRMKHVQKAKVENKEFVSIDPTNILTSDTLWVYNIKTRKLGKYVAEAGKLLSVKGSTILNYDPKQSYAKTLRKPKAQLEEFLECGKVAQRKFLHDIKAKESFLNGRINNKTLLMKVF